MDVTLADEYTNSIPSDEGKFVSHKSNTTWCKTMQGATICNMQFMQSEKLYRVQNYANSKIMQSVNVR